MFGMSHQLTTKTPLDSCGFGILKRRCPTLIAFILSFFCCTAVYATPAQAQEPKSLTLHPSISAAQTVAAGQQRPVCVIFTAEWSPASTQLRKHVLTDPDAMSLLSTCFECVLIDVDSNPDVTNKFGIQHVPSGCILNAQGTVLSRFECPSSTSLFIAAVARQLPHATSESKNPFQSPDLERAVAVPSETPKISTDFSTAGTLLADGAATGPTTVSKSENGIAAKVRGLSSFAMTEPSFPKEVNEPMAPQIPSQEIPSQETLAQKIPAQEKISVTHFPTAIAAATTQSTMGKPAPQPSMFQEETAEITPTSAPWQVSPRTPAAPIAATAAVPAISNSGAAPWQPEVGYLHPETGTPADTDYLASLSSAPRAVPIENNDGSYPEFIEPETPRSEATMATQSPWLPAAAGASVASAAQASDSMGTAPDQSIPSQQAVAASAATASPSSDEPLPAEKAMNPFIAAIQKPFSVFSTEAEPEVEATQQITQKPVQQITRKPVHASYASQPPAEKASEEIEPQQTMPLGLEGYCPVALLESGNWVEGQARWGARHRGRTYLFSGLEQQQIFLTDPDRYAPALSGDDPVAAFDGRTTIAGQRRYGVTYQQRIYLFESPETRAKFATNPQRYTSRVILAEQPTQGGDTILR
jgi:YHS domain-containing protein